MKTLLNSLRQLRQAPVRNGFANTGGQLRDYIRKQMDRCLREGEKERDQLECVDDVRKWQQEFRAFMGQSLGGLPVHDAKTPYEVIGEVRHEGYRVRKILYQSAPDVPVTALLWLPDGDEAPRPGILFLPGHELEGKNSPMYLSVCTQLANAGFAVLSIDPIGQGERLSYWESALGKPVVRWGICDHEYAGRQALLTGRTLGYYFLRDAIRGLDVLQTMPEVDGSRLGVTGNSGGGLLTAVLSALDERVAVACPGTFITNLECLERSGQAQDAEQLWPGFVAAGHDHESLLAAFAPRPIMLLASRWDSFPIEGTLQTHERAKRIWGLWDRVEDCELFIDDAPHLYTDKHAQSAAAFFRKHLGGGEDRSICFEPPEAIQVTRNGQVRDDYPSSKTVFEQNIQRFSELSKRSASDTITWLQDAIHKLPLAKPYTKIAAENASGQIAWKRLLWYSHEGVLSHGELITNTGAEEAGLCLMISKSGLEGLLEPTLQSLLNKYQNLFLLDLNGYGVLSPDAINPRRVDGFYGTLHKLCDDFARLGDSMPAFHAREVISALTALEALGDNVDVVDIALIGVPAFPGLCAACCLPNVRRLYLEDEFYIFRFADIALARYYPFDLIKPLTIPGMLEYLDVDAILRYLEQRGTQIISMSISPTSTCYSGESPGACYRDTAIARLG